MHNTQDVMNALDLFFANKHAHDRLKQQEEKRLSQKSVKREICDKYKKIADAKRTII